MLYLKDLSQGRMRLGDVSASFFLALKATTSFDKRLP